MDKYLVKINPRELIKGKSYVFKYNPPLEGDDRDLRPGEEPNVNINKREGILSNIDRTDGTATFYVFKNVTYIDEPERPMKETGRYISMMATENAEHILEFYAIPRAAFEGAGIKRRRTRRNMRFKRRKTKRNRKTKRRRRYM